MRTWLVTGTDTGVGKTHAVAALARWLADATPGRTGQIVKAIETGVARDQPGDAQHALALAERPGLTAHRLLSWPAALAPLAAAALVGEKLSTTALLTAWAELPPCDWRIVEGAGGLSVPLTAEGADWTTAATWFDAEAVIIVVPDRLGAINQARLAWSYALAAGLRRVGLWLNAPAAVDPLVAQSHRTAFAALSLPVWAEQAHGQLTLVNTALLQAQWHPRDAATPLPCRASASPPLYASSVSTDATPAAPEPTPSTAPSASPLSQRCAAALAERATLGLRRHLRVHQPVPDVLNLADNDYLDLARDPALAAAAASAAHRVGSSAAASPLITGWRASHAQLIAELAAWHGFNHGLVFSSGFAANAAVLGVLPQRGDLVLADRLIHHSMVAGLLRSGARFQRYPHLDLDALAATLAATNPARITFVVTESLFSMDGDYPDLARLAALKQRHRFCWILDEAHALGWYGPAGAGLASAAAVTAHVDVLVGTLGKTLAAGGAYVLAHDRALIDTLINEAGEFIYSTALPPATAEAARAALARVRALAPAQGDWQAQSRALREALRTDGWSTPAGDSPIVPVQLGDAQAATALAEGLRRRGILAAAVRPPTVPAGTSRLRFSLKRTFGPSEQARLLAALAAARKDAA